MGRWVTVNEAAEALGISTDALRKRIQRGALESTREHGRVLVWLDESGTDEAGTLKDDLIAFLRQQLEEERRANRENRQIIAGLIERIPELEAPAERPPESPETASEGQDKGTPGAGPETGTQRRSSWWRRVFGG